MSRYTDDYSAPTKAEADREAADDKAVAEADRLLWWSDHTNLFYLAEYMSQTGDDINIVPMLEKPWKWTYEFIQAVHELATEWEEPFDAAFQRTLAELTPRATVVIPLPEVMFCVFCNGVTEHDEDCTRNEFTEVDLDAIDEGYTPDEDLDRGDR